MTVKGIAYLLAGKQADQQERDIIETRVFAFFTKFEALGIYKKYLEQKLHGESVVLTPFGNHRKRIRTGPLSPKEKRWAVNQVIQGTASLIFKKALLALRDEFGKRAIVLPVHDAVLMQFAEGTKSKAIPIAVKLMENAFLEFCPEIKGRVTHGGFAPD